MWLDITDKKDAPMVSTKNIVFLDNIYLIYCTSLTKYAVGVCCDMNEIP